jgi:hypothetical protein
MTSVRAITMGNAASRNSERGHDPYDTGPEAPHALVDAERERLPRFIWEPACGCGDIVNALRLRGHTVFASDLIDCGLPDAEIGTDFLKATKLPNHQIQAIVTNPPFKLAAEFAEHALQLCPRVYLLLRLNFLEGGTQKPERARVLDDGSLARVLVFANRLPRMHRRNWSGKKTGPTMVMAWFVWDRMRKPRPPIIRRIWWQPVAHLFEGPEEAQRRKIREAGKLNPDPGPLFAKRK